MLRNLFTIEIIGKTQGGLNNFEHNCTKIGKKMSFSSDKMSIEWEPADIDCSNFW